MKQFLDVHMLCLIGCYFLAACGTKTVREAASLYESSHYTVLPPGLHSVLFPLFHQRPRLKMDIALALVSYVGILICVVYKIGGMVFGYAVTTELSAFFASLAVMTVLSAVIYKVALHCKRETAAGMKLFYILLLLCCFAAALAVLAGMICRLAM